MAEQDREDLVPSVLNDLMDVDGEPVEGDGMSFTDGAWRPGPGGGILPPYGPALTFWRGQYDGADAATPIAQRDAWSSIVMGLDDYSYLGDLPVLGAWTADSDSGIQRWRTTEPGFYRVYLHTKMIASAYHASAYGAGPHALSIIGDYTWGYDRQITVRSVSQTYVFTQDLVLPISQGMIDAGFGGFDAGYPLYTPGGAEGISAQRLIAVIERYSPGSTFDYFGDL